MSRRSHCSAKANGVMQLLCFTLNRCALAPIVYYCNMPFMLDSFNASRHTVPDNMSWVDETDLYKNHKNEITEKNSSVDITRSCHESAFPLHGVDGFRKTEMKGFFKHV